MPTKRFEPGQIVNRLRKMEVEVANGKKAAQAARDEGTCEQTYYLYGQLPFCKKDLDDGKRGRLHTCIRRQQE